MVNLPSAVYGITLPSGPNSSEPQRKDANLTPFHCIVNCKLYMVAFQSITHFFGLSTARFLFLSLAQMAAKLNKLEKAKMRKETHREIEEQHQIDSKRLPWMTEDIGLETLRRLETERVSAEATRVADDKQKKEKECEEAIYREVIRMVTVEGRPTDAVASTAVVTGAVASGTPDQDTRAVHVRGQLVLIHDLTQSDLDRMTDDEFASYETATTL